CFYGPYWDHILGYWKASLEHPGKILFSKYEEMSRDTTSFVKKLAEFTGHPFSFEEQQKGVPEKIVKLCSFENLSNLEVNKNGMHRVRKIKNGVENKNYFRKGKVGDWKNHLTPEMAARLDEITLRKLDGSGLSL
ncbi:MAG: sulfotransferase domain-containing protein, partial [Candidatus Phytoplasma australasiaticum]|nr:sulfotransferase domain-containing protein [Candidatus Phytoplasma australasiaticum]